MDILTHPSKSEVKRLLTEAGLPTSDLSEGHLAQFFGCRHDSELEGVVGLEVYGDVALLRSLAVAPGRRGAGLGSHLVAHAERHAWKNGVKSLYLLTTTAENFFLRRGYATISRQEAPAAIKATKEFSGICPVSSAFMVKYLDS